MSRPDTLLAWTGSNGQSYYRRLLPGGAVVWFDASGRHVQTENRLHQVTRFVYTTAGLLDSLVLPVPAGGTAPYYRFSYEQTSGRLTEVSAPGLAGGRRYTEINFGTQGINWIQDPDGAVASFGYDGVLPHRVTSRTDARGTRTDFAYRQWTNTLVGWTVGANTTQAATTQVWPQELQGSFGQAALLSLASTFVDGPRTDVGDTTRIWQDSLGAPSRIRDALGSETLVTRGDARFPALATQVDAPGGGAAAGSVPGSGPRQVSRAHYNARGNVDTTTVVNPLGDGQNAVTTYAYTNSAWPDFATQATSPTGIVSQTGYDALGNAVTQQVGSDSRRAVNAYYNAWGAVDSVRSAAAQARGERPSRYTYDGTLGNLASQTTPLGRTTSYTTDPLGRNTQVVSPVDSATATYNQQNITYDAADRVLSTTTTAAGQSVSVATVYDSAGLVLSTTRTMSPDTNHIGTMTVSYHYDALGRRTSETNPDLRSDSTAYDVAGNVVLQVTRRSSQFGPSNLTMAYDALGRLTRRITPSYSYFQRTRTDLNNVWTFSSQALDPDNPGNPRVISGDTATFTYDAAGGILTANNHDARITRTYLPGGALGTETQAIRTYTGANFTSHVYTVGYRYDRAGRRTVLKHPGILAPAAGQDSVVYGYDAATGALASVTDPMGAAFGFSYDWEGQLIGRAVPGGIAETTGYDADGRLIQRVLAGATAGTLFADTLVYDQRDKVVTARGTDKAQAIYTGLGTLRVWKGQVPGQFELNTNVIDPLANVASEDRRWVDDDAAYGKMHTFRAFHYEPHTGRQLQIDEYNTLDNSVTNQDVYEYDGAGNQDWHLGAHYGTSNSYGTRVMHERTASFFGADDRLRAVDRQRCLSQSYPAGGNIMAVTCGAWDETLGQDPSAFEEYRYDALGRRVLVRRRLYEVNGPCSGGYHTCNSGVERFVYDGDQLIWEIRSPEQPGDSPNVLEYDAAVGDFGGRVGYTHGGGMDAPLSVIRVGMNVGTMDIVPHANWRGMFAKGTFANGTTTQGSFQTNMIQWPGGNADAWHAPMAAGQPSYWFGSLIADQRDASGLMYRRNRMYDPATGRFTQEDPIGIGGGLNTYGFGGGDAVNFSDPYGLNCTDKNGHEIPCPPNSTPHVYAVSIGAAGAFLVGGNVNLGIAFNSRGFRLFANAGGSFGLGATASKVQVSREEGTLDNYAPLDQPYAFNGPGSLSIATPFFGYTRINSEKTADSCSHGCLLFDSNRRHTGDAASLGPGIAVLYNYTDGQVSSRVVSWLAPPYSAGFACAKAGIGCSNSNH